MKAVQYRTIGAAPEVVEIETRTRGCTKVRWSGAPSSSPDPDRPTGRSPIECQPPTPWRLALVLTEC